MSEPPIHVHKVSYAVPFSRDLLIEYGVIEPTPAEYARMQREAAESRERATQREAIMDAARVRLAAIEDPLARGVLDLHREDEWHECRGCDVGGHDGGPPDWPCRTVELIAKQYEIRLS